MSKKIRRKCFYTLNYIVALVFIFSVCLLDSNSWIPTIVCYASLIYGAIALYICNLAEEERGK